MSRSRRRCRLGAVAALLVTYLALGGASYKPTPVADPCATREWRDPGGVQAVLEQIALSGLDGAACKLGVSREELVLALRDQDALDPSPPSRGSRARTPNGGAGRAAPRGRRREAAGALSGFVGSLVRSAVERVPPR